MKYALEFTALIMHSCPHTKVIHYIPVTDDQYMRAAAFGERFNVLVFLIPCNMFYNYKHITFLYSM